MEEHQTDSGIEIQPVYTAADLADDVHERLGRPGAAPYTRGVYAEMYRKRRWTMRQYSGFGTADETNARFHYLLKVGQTGLSCAFDLPTPMPLIPRLLAYCKGRTPRLNPVPLSGYPIREAGATAVQGVAFTLSNGIAYVQAAIDAGLSVDEFAPRLSFFFNAHNNFFEEVAKFRAARRMWYRIMTERFGAQDERSKLLRFHTQTGGSTLTAQQPENNVARVTLQALAAVFGGTQSLHTNSFDEAIGLPTERAAKIALRTQQIIGFESGVVDTVDPLAGSYFVESLTDQIEADALRYLDKIDGMGGAVAAIEAGYMQDEIEQSSYAYAKAVEGGEKVIVGVNRFVEDEPEPQEVFPIDPRLQRQQAESVR